MKGLLNKYITIEPGFQKSVNLFYDLSDEAKVVDFIPSQSSIEILETFLLSTYPNSVDRAHILVGPYGKGKSHIVLVLLSLLKDKNQSVFIKVLDEIKKYSSDLYDYVISYLNSDTKLLPVIIQGSNNSLNQSFLAAIQTALRDADLEDVMPGTHFQAAIKHIENWQTQYPEAAHKFSLLISPTSIEDFLLKLKNFDSEAYEQFVAVYPQLSAGGVFNPFGGVDVVELYENVVTAIQERGYSGIFLVYDEFSKYLEANIKAASISDIKMLQDFAEKCNRSKDKQLHLLLIAHKNIENYIDQLPKSKVDGWRGVSERFTHVEMQSNYSQVYEIMSKAIPKTPEFYSEFLEEHKAVFAKLQTSTIVQSLFDDLSVNQQENICTECYPLHIVSAFILPRLSELVAQNERTLFTFISGNSKNTLSYLLNRKNSLDKSEPFITPDAIYDYFEPLFKKEVYTSDIFKIYSIVSSILVKVKDNPLQKKIVKDLALIYLINQFERIEPVPYTIYNLFPASKKNEVIEAINDLENKEYVLYAKKSNGYLRLKSPSNANVQDNIKNEISKEKVKNKVIEILQAYASDSYLYPTAYNEERGLIRYFALKFISATDVLAVDNWNIKLSMESSDGAVYAVVAEDEYQLQTVRAHLLKNENYSKLAIFILPKNFVEIKEIVFKYQAVLNLISASKDDEALIAELEIIKDDLDEVLYKFLNSYVRPELGKVEYICANSLQRISRKSHLSRLLSDSCYEVFQHTPIINNETINKNEISGTTNNSRAKVISSLLQEHLAPKLGLNTSGQEGFIARSVLSETGILENFTENPAIVEAEDIKDENIRNVISLIKNFFDSCAIEKHSFTELYDNLTKSSKGIGLRKGVIPIFIAAVLHNFLGQIAIYSQDKEVDLDEKLLLNINNNPDIYSARLQNWDEDKLRYIKQLSETFRDYFAVKGSLGNQFTLLAQALQRWFISLPKYAKETKCKYLGQNNCKDLESYELKFATSLKNLSLNSYDFIFIKIPEIFNKPICDKELVALIQKTKSDFDEALLSLNNGLICDLKEIFNPNAHVEASLTSLIKDWYEDLRDETKNHVFDAVKSSLLGKCANPGNDDISFIKDIARVSSGLRLEDWSINTICDFLNSIREFKFNVDRFNLHENQSLVDSKNSYVLTSTDSQGNQYVKTFEHIEYSDIAKLLKNEVMNALDEMGQSISDAEKRQVLIEALESLC